MANTPTALFVFFVVGQVQYVKRSYLFKLAVSIRNFMFKNTTSFCKQVVG